MSLDQSIFTEPNLYSSGAAETVSLVTGSSPLAFGAKLLKLIADSSSSSASWVQVFDGYAAPSSGAVPMLSLRLAANAQAVFDVGAANSLPVSSGIVVALSSTGPTYTAVSNHLFLTAMWI